MSEPASFSQSAVVHGDGNIVVQSTGCVQIWTPADLRLQSLSELRSANPLERQLDLLNAFCQQPIAFVGRETERSALLTWCADERRVLIRVMTGGAGRGKTRLAIETLRALETLPDEKAWQGGFLSGRELRRFTGQSNFGRWSWQRPTFIVLDYAATIAEPLREWLQELVLRTPQPGAKLRLLLLERDARRENGWFEQCLPAGQRYGGCARLFDPPEPVPLAELPHGATRRAILFATLREGAAVAQCPQPVLPAAGTDADLETRLQADQWADPLALMMAGVVALETQVATALSFTRTDLADHLARRERDRLAGFIPTGSSRKGIELFAAHVNLTGALDEAAALQAARTICDEQGRQSPGGPNQLVEALRTAWPAETGLVPLQPDLLAEMVVLQVAQVQRDSVPSALVRRAFAQAPQGTIAALIRTARDFAWSDPYADPQKPPLRWLTELVTRLEESEEFSTLFELWAALPEHSVALRELAVRILGLLVAWMRATAVDDETLALRARMLSAYGNALSEAGRWSETLPPAAEAVRLYRDLVSRQPDVFPAALATSLNNLANHYSALGRWEDALPLAEEAKTICHDLAARQPEAFLPDLATCLNSLSTFYIALGRRAEALPPSKEAVRIYRDLAGRHPDAFLPDLAMSLDNLSNRYSELGGWAEALPPSKEAVRLYSDLAERQSDAFLPDLARSLNNLAIHFSDLGHGAEAFPLAEEAVRLYRDLAGRHPDAFHPALAGSLNKLRASNKTVLRGIL